MRRWCLDDYRCEGGVTVFGLGPKCDDLQCLGALRLGEQKLIDVLLDNAEG